MFLYVLYSEGATNSTMFTATNDGEARCKAVDLIHAGMAEPDALPYRVGVQVGTPDYSYTNNGARRLWRFAPMVTD